MTQSLNDLRIEAGMRAVYSTWPSMNKDGKFVSFDEINEEQRKN